MDKDWGLVFGIRAASEWSVRCCFLVSYLISFFGVRFGAYSPGESGTVILRVVMERRSIDANEGIVLLEPHLIAFVPAKRIPFVMFLGMECVQCLREIGR